MISNRLLIYPPQSPTAEYEILPEDATFEWQLGYPGTAVFTVYEDWLHLGDESDTTNPCQINAYIKYYEGSTCIFRGTVIDIGRQIIGNKTAITLDCMDGMYALTHTLTRYDDGTTVRSVFRRASATAALSNIRLYPGFAYSENLFQYTYYPLFSSAAWLGTASSTAFVIIDDMAGTADAIPELVVGATAAGGYPAVPPRGFFSVTVGGDTEFCEYNGMQFDVSQPAGQEWKLLNVKRVRLGSVQTDPSANQTAYLRLSKRIAVESRILIEGVYSGDTNATPIPDVNYEVNYEDGSFIFGNDPLELRTGTAFDYMRATYHVYDEDSGTPANVLHLSEVFADALDVAQNDGGPNIGSTQRTITLSPDPVITQVTVNEPIYFSDFKRRMLFELGLAKGAGVDIISDWYDSSTGKYTIRTMSQAAAGSEDRVYDGESAMQEDMSLEDIKSAVLVRYQEGGGFNLLGGPRFWHTQSYGTTDPGSYPQRYLKEAGVWAANPTGQPSVYNASYGKAGSVITDNDSTSGMALVWDTDPTTAGDNILYGWFPGTSNTAPSTFYVTNIIAVFELKGKIAGPMQISIKAINGFSKTGDSEPTGTVTDISPQLTQMWGVSDDAYPASVNYGSFELKADNLHVPMQGIVIHVTRLVGEATEVNDFAFKLLDIYVQGFHEREELVRLTGTYDSSAGAGVLVATDSFNKLVDTNSPQHHVYVLDVGPSTRDVALYLGWLQLLQTLALSQSRVYRIETASLEQEGIAIVGETIATSDGYSGLCDNIRYHVGNSGRREMEIRLVNFNGILFGMSQ